MASFGYGGDIGAGQWVTEQRIIGARYALLGPGHLRLGVTTTGITLAAGAAGGGGVYDEWTTLQNVALSKPASGTSWWLICIRRNWTSGTTSLVAIPAGTGTAAPTLPTRNTDMGTVDDQPLWLVPWASTNSTPTLGNAIDLRLIGRGPSNYVAFDDRVREYFSEAGATLRIGAIDWICAIGSGDVLTWVQSGVLGSTGTTTTGTFDQLPNGTLICSFTRVFTGGANDDQVYPWTYPVSFIATPKIFVTPQTSAPQNCSTSVSSPTSTGANIRFRRSTNVDTTVDFMAIGRWK